MPPAKHKHIAAIMGRPTLVLAGPGAGKTYLLAERVKRLLESGVDRNSITVLTFGKDASEHMKAVLTDPEGDFQLAFGDLPHISTMHSLGLEIVQKMARAVGLRKKGLRVQSDDNVRRLMYRDAALVLGLTEAQSLEAMNCKQRGDCQEDARRDICSICATYRDIMSKCNCIDFDDQILLCLRILSENAKILRGYRSQATHLLVDEYQDINTAQFNLIELLSSQSRTGLFVVGDDAQSIYGFRGADPGFILRFSIDFPGAECPPLAHSRRCHEKIMRDASAVLAKYYSDWRGPHELKFHVPSGPDPEVRQLASDKGEARMVARIARSAIIAKKTVLVLAPKREFFRLLIRELSNFGVPWQCLESFVPDRMSVAVRFLQWAQMADDSFAARLVIEDVINRGIARIPGAKKDKRSTPETIQRRIAEETKIANLWKPVTRQKCLFDVIREASGKDHTLTKIRDALVGLIACYEDCSGENRGEFIKKLCLASGIWIDPKALDEDISQMMEIVQPQRGIWGPPARLMTMRKAKGLEADVVIIVGLEDDIIPNPRSSDITEEARLFYVSMTRAREELHLLHAYKRPRNISYGQQLTRKARSRFLDAIGRKSRYTPTT